MKILWKALCALAIVSLTIVHSHADGKVIKMGTLSWEDLTPITGITKKALENAGYTVEVTSFSEWGIAYAALSKGDIQVLTSQIDYAAHDYWNRSKNRLEKISPVSHGLYQGIAVPRYVTIDSIEQLNENAEKFGNKIVGIEPGSGLMSDAANAVSAYGIKLNLLEGSTAAMTAALKSSVDRKDWVAVAIWEPSWMTQKFDVKFLKDPKGIFPPPQGYYWIAQKGFSEKNPQAREVIAGVYVPLADITAINGEVKDGKTMDQAVSDWSDKHAELLKRWNNIKKY
ncbi:glycine betaine/proline transport system substrate-binding protein [Pseudomonas flavescens]|uniref:Glycine betaine/proline transport system substrate-binding protein n=1 Tax=Phytopseudomonas flavescens TaxID=29435 RepID=A0A1G8P801_9GAMM|nr:glycine betaine ABC transporter substrate-binding protein [Pseudomonas flavescens]SDI88445.1 glycine betaine/proline transport system substrate-binding protein [Pseudomonas flavescens]